MNTAGRPDDTGADFQRNSEELRETVLRTAKTVERNALGIVTRMGEDKGFFALASCAA